MQLDWTGSKNAIFTTHGASNHSEGERAENDYYATDPAAAKKLLEVEDFSDYIWECAVGGGHIASVLDEAGYTVLSTDIVDRGYKNTEIIDFLKADYNNNFDGDIITNPPYRYAAEFVERAVKSVSHGHKVAMLLKLTFLEGQKREKLFKKYPPKKIYVFIKRINCFLNGNMDIKGGSAVAYAWFVWEKGYSGKPVIDWI